MPSRSWTPQLLAAIRAMARRGWSTYRIGAALDIKPNTVQQWMIRYHIAPASPPLPPHGTSTRYSYHGCRCPQCRAAHAARVLGIQAGPGAPRTPAPPTTGGRGSPGRTPSPPTAPCPWQRWPPPPDAPGPPWRNAAAPS